MEILDRYLHAVEFWLPKSQRRDIIVELSEDIHSQIEEQQDALGRKLTEAEVESLIQQRGRPLLVASRYLPERVLIGPALLPAYLLALRIVAAFLVVSTVLFIIGQRVSQPTLSWLSTFATAFGSLWTAAFIFAGSITIIFAVLQRVEYRKHFLEKWNPRQLPPLRNIQKISRPNSAFEIAINLAVVAWFVRWIWSPELFGVRFSFTPTWPYLALSVLILIAANTAISAVNLVKPYWTITRGVLRLVTDVAGSALFCWALKANAYAIFTFTTADETRVRKVLEVVHSVSDKLFPFAVLVVLAVFVTDLYRVIRIARRDDNLIDHAIAT